MAEPNPTDSRYVSRLTQDTLALVLAGGQGARLYELTRWRAKPSVYFGGHFRLIDFPLSNCIHSGIRRIGVLTQYKAHSLIRHLVQGWTGRLQAGREFLLALYAAFRSLKLYPLENAVVQKSLDEITALADALLKSEGELEVRLSGDFLFVNQTRLRLELDNYASFSQLLTKVSAEAVERLAKRVTRRAQSNEPIGSFRAMYDLWVDSGEEAFAAAAHGADFAKAQSELNDALMALKSAQHKQVEDWARSLDLPTRTEMNTVLKRLNTLRRRVREMEDELDALKQARRP